MNQRNKKVIDFSKDPLAIIADIVKKTPRYKKSGSVLDLGTGTGRHALFLAQKGFKVTALDSIKRKLIKLRKVALKRNIRLSYIHANIKNFKPSKKYDILIATMSLHFLKKLQVSKAIEMMKRTTKSGGLNVIVVHTTQNIKSHHRPHLFKKNELRKYYSNWKILQYKESWGLPLRFKKRGRLVRRHRAGLIARKPSSR